jgi:hypothetical protein
MFNCGHKQAGHAVSPRRNTPETVLKPDCPELRAPAARPTERTGETIMIQIGSKEEVAFLLALFGTHTQPVKRPKPKSRQG